MTSYYTSAERSEIKRVVRTYDRNVLARHLAIIGKSDARTEAQVIGLIVRKQGHAGLIDYIARMHRVDRTDTTIAGALIAERMAFIKGIKMLRAWSYEIMGDAA